jgi:hypothetical protein
MYVPFVTIRIGWPNYVNCLENRRMILYVKSRTRGMLYCRYSYISCLVTTDCKGQNPSWGAAGRSACHGIQHHHHINKRSHLPLLWTTPTQCKSSHPVSLRLVSIRSAHLLVDLSNDGFWGWGVTETVKQLGPFYPRYCPVACLIRFVLTTKWSAKVR